MAAYFSAENLATLNNGREQVHRQLVSLREAYFLRKYKSDRAREYAMHGFCRRLGILARAIDLVFEGLPPEREDIPDRNEVVDATIAIQSFVSNTFGCLDNLAWICVYEKDVRSEDGAELNPRSIGLGKGNKQVRSSFSNEFRAYLDTRQKWFDHLKGFRDSLAHRIPLYIPPYTILTQETMDEYNKLEQASDEALQQGDLEEYDRSAGSGAPARSASGNGFPAKRPSWNRSLRTKRTALSALPSGSGIGSSDQSHAGPARSSLVMR